jgi:hypothetical protein
MRINLPNKKVLATAAAILGTGAALGHEQAARVHPAPGTAPAPLANAAPVPAPVAASATAARAVLSGVGIENGARGAQVQGALAALSGQVREQSHPDALKLAFEAYYNFKAAHPEKVRKPYLYFVDYGLDSHTPRGYVFDMNALRVVDGPFTVAHGRGSGSKDGVPTKFSNREGSATSSLGLFVGGESYAFTGHTGGKAYRSVGLRLDGVSGEFNDQARRRRVVVHGAPYVTASKAGRSEGCPAMEPARAKSLIPKISRGGMIFLFSPVDHEWMAEDPWTHGQMASAD